VTTPAIHRVIEQHAALRGNFTAILDGDRAVSYRELNYAANAVARRLLGSGFRRGGHALVAMPVGIDLAIVLLAILKSGGSYTWADPAAAPDLPPGVSIAGGLSSGERRYLHLDLSSVLAEPVASCPNLPIITRGADAACLLQEAGGSPAVMVPHATITALRSRSLPQPAPWMGDPGAFDLWMALMSGTTATVGAHGAAVAA
jgi:hypothetical protein